MMKKKIWFFGDSFTNGDGCIPNNDASYYEDYPELRDRIWTNLVTEKLSGDEMNFGESGGSNDWILNTIIDNLHLIEDTDVVFLSDTQPSRHLIPRVHDNIIHCFAPNQESVWDWHIKNRSDTIKPKNWKSMKRTLVDYTYYYRHNYFDLWESYYDDRFSNLQKYFDKRGIKNYRWSYKLWYEKQINFELINDHIPTIHNYHFSWKGHKQFADHIYTNFRKKYERLL